MTPTPGRALASQAIRWPPGPTGRGRKQFDHRTPPPANWWFSHTGGTGYRPSSRPNGTAHQGCQRRWTTVPFLSVTTRLPSVRMRRTADQFVHLDHHHHGHGRRDAAHRPVGVLSHCQERRPHIHPGHPGHRGARRRPRVRVLLRRLWGVVPVGLGRRDVPAYHPRGAISLATEFDWIANWAVTETFPSHSAVEPVRRLRVLRGVRSAVRLLRRARCHRDQRHQARREPTRRRVQGAPSGPRSRSPPRPPPAAVRSVRPDC
ncbi:hypothetical protein RKD19_000219 [Streptomyces canus]